MPDYLSFDGVPQSPGKPFLDAGNLAFRYGEGLFETMYMRNGRIRLARHHFDRLHAGLRILGFDPMPQLTIENLEAELINGCRHLDAHQPLRVRLQVFRDVPDQGQSSEQHYVVEANRLAPKPGSKEGMRLAIFPEGRKAIDAFSSLKSSNHLVYLAASRYALAKNVDDAVVINSAGRVSDTSIANLFCIYRNKIYTPALSEGCIAGTMRRFLLEQASQLAINVEETAIDPDFLARADELFLTNALRDILPVISLEGKSYITTATQSLRSKLMDLPEMNF